MIAKHRRTNLFFASFFMLALSGLPDPAAGADKEKASTTYYLIGDLHIGGKSLPLVAAFAVEGYGFESRWRIKYCK